MGCNSHTYIEYRRKEHKDANWMSLLQYEVDQRHYPLYAKMAGVRNYGDQITPIAPPSGFPEGAGYDTKRNYYLRINDKLASDGEPGFVSSGDASEWISEGISSFCSDDIYYLYQRPRLSQRVMAHVGRVRVGCTRGGLRRRVLDGRLGDGRERSEYRRFRVSGGVLVRQLKVKNREK